MRDPAEVQRRQPPLRLAVYAGKSVGKTTLGLTAAKPIVLDLDGSLEGEAIPPDVDALEWTPDRWGDLNAFYHALRDKLPGRKTVVIDTGDALARFLINESIDTWDSASRGPNAAQVNIGKAVPEKRDYNALAMAMDRFLTMLRATGLDIIMVCQTRPPDPEHGEYRRGLNLPFATRGVVEDWANVMGELVLSPAAKAEDEKRILHWGANDPERRSGNRWRSVLGRAMSEPTIPKIKRAIARAYTAPKEGASS